MRNFYTYVHCLPDDTPFYVGKGHGKRCRDFLRRNIHHRKITAEIGIENVAIYIFPCNSEAQARADEIRLIARLRAEGFDLANMSDGGEGASGVKRSAEHRQRLRESALAQWSNPDHRARMSEKLMGNKNGLGIKRSAETSERMSISIRKAMQNPEVKARMSANLIGNKRGKGRKRLH